MSFTAPTPEELLKRAMDALDVAETIAAKAPQRAEEWALVSRAASDAGQLAALCRDRIVVIDGPSGQWQRMVEEHGEKARMSDTPPQVLRDPDDPHSGANVWVSADEWETIQALRAGAAVVTPTPKAYMPGSESPIAARSRRRGGVPYPRDLDQSDVDADADRMQAQAVLEESLTEARALVAGVMMACDTVSIYLTEDRLAEAQRRQVEVHKHPRGGVSLRLAPADELTEPA